MDQLYGMFKGPQTDVMPGVLTLAGPLTRLTLWRQNQPLVPYFPKRVFGRLNDKRKMTLWGLHGEDTVPDDLLHPWHGNGVEAVTATPMYGVDGPCEFDPDCTLVAAVTFRSPHLELDSDPSQATETAHGTLTATAATDWSRHGKPRPVTEIRLAFPDPVPFESDGRRRLAALSFLCEALTGRAHNFNGTEFEVPFADYAYRLHDFHTAETPVFPRYEELDTSPHPHVAPVEFLDIGARWLDLFLDQDSTYPEIFSYLSASLDMHIRYDRLRVFQSVNVFDLCPAGPGCDRTLRNRITGRIERVAAEIEKLGLHPELSFTADNLRKFAAWGADLRHRVVHGPVDTRGKEPKPRPAYCDDPGAWGYVCNTLEFVLVLSTLIECGLDFRQWHARSQPRGRNKFRDVTFQFEKIVSYIEDRASPAGISSAGKAGA